MRTVCTPVSRLLAAAAFTAAAVPALAQQGPVVIYSEIQGDPSAVIPGTRDLMGNPAFSEFRQISDLNLSPDGTWWILRGRTQLGSDLENVMILGTGEAGCVFAQEGQPSVQGVVGELYDFFDGIAGILNNGDFAFGARTRGGPAGQREKVIRCLENTGDCDALDCGIVVQEGDPAMGLVDLPPNPSGDETFGNSLNGIHILDDKVRTVGFAAATLNNIHSSRRPAIFYAVSASENMAFAQAGVTTITDINGVEQTWTNFLLDEFYTTPDGMHWYAQGAFGPILARVDILAVDGEVVVQENEEIGETGVTAVGIFNTVLLPNGDWLARGDDAADADWAVRNNMLVARTGEPIVPDSDELWGDAFSAFTGNANGDSILVGNTNSTDPARDQVVVLNGSTVILREGDPVDVDGDGEFDDDAFIGRGTNTTSAFQADDFVLTDEGVLYFLASLRNGAGMDLSDPDNFTGGDAFLRLDLDAGPACPCDWDNSGTVNSDDYFLFLTDFFAGNADFNGDGEVNSDDYFAFLDCFFDLPGGCR